MEIYSIILSSLLITIERNLRTLDFSLLSGPGAESAFCLHQAALPFICYQDLQMPLPCSMDGVLVRRLTCEHTIRAASEVSAHGNY